MARFTRRSALAAVCAAPLGVHFLGSVSTASTSASKEPAPPTGFSYALNTGTLRGFELGIEEEIEVVAKAGYRLIEPWIGHIAKYVEQGGKLSELKKRLDGHGMQAINAIGFAPWIVDDDAKRAAGVEQLKREMGMLREIGCPRVAAAAAGASSARLADFAVLGARYRTILELGASMDVIPQLEIWGGSQTLTTIADALAVAAHAAHPQAALLLDAYHMYKGGSSVESLRLVSGTAMGLFHINDYPADPPRATIQDKDRVYPGDGVAPLRAILTTLKRNGFSGALSFEVFNRDYWATGDPLGVARTALEKMKAIAEGG